jgi:elongation factor G
MPSDFPKPPPLIEIAIEPKSKADQEKLGVALARLTAEDPSFAVSTDLESGQTILKGLGELHLDAKVKLLKRYGIGFNVGAPQVAFRETVTRRVEHGYTHKRQDRGKGQFASVTLVVEPNETDKGYEFESKIAEGVVPEEYLPGIIKGIESVLSSGVVAGFPVVDIKVQLVEGKYHDIDSSALAFEIATRACFREALQKAGSVLLEPIVKVDVTTPADYIGVIAKDVNQKRGQLLGQDSQDGAVTIHALVPLMNLFGYATDLREKSNGRASFTMQFDHYAPAPPNVPHDDPPFRPAIGMRPW